MQRKGKKSDPNPGFMSLDDFQMPGFLSAQLYKNALVDLDENGLIYLGNNKKSILIIADDEDATHLSGEDLDFLIGILTACKLSLEDTTFINFNKNAHADYNMLMKQFRPVTIICLGIDLSILDFPLQFPHYQVQQYNSCQVITAPSLGAAI